MRLPTRRRALRGLAGGLGLASLTPLKAFATSQPQFTIYFDEGSNILSQEGITSLNKAFDYILSPLAAADRDGLDRWLNVIGYADQNEIATDLMELSKLRAWHVADKLVAMGVPGNKIATDWFGATRLASSYGGPTSSNNRQADIFPLFPIGIGQNSV